MSDSESKDLSELLLRAIEYRKDLMEAEHQTAFRLFNGFYEGNKDLVADVYGSSLILFDYCKEQTRSKFLMQTAADVIKKELPWIKCIIVKHHTHPNEDMRRGEIIFGDHSEKLIVEYGVKYAVDLQLNQDAGLYLDTRYLRNWLLNHCAGMEVLNTFAYTGSLGVAALAGGAYRVVQMDRNRRFLETARRSASLNHLDLQKMKLSLVDFFVGVGQLKRNSELFDLVILDPPYFSVTERGLVDQASESHRLINKVRPLVKDGGFIVAINNSLFLQGAAYMQALESLAQDGYMSIEEIIPIPEDFTGYPGSILTKPPLDPSPFNHPTKIVVLKIKKRTKNN